MPCAKKPDATDQGSNFVSVAWRTKQCLQVHLA